MPNRAISLVWIKLGVIAVLGGAFVFVLNQNRGQSVNAVAGRADHRARSCCVILWIGTFVLDRTKFGRYLYAIGGNAEAARRSGVKVRWIKWWAFVICSCLAVVSALFSVSRVGSVDATVGRDIVLSGVAAAVVGGVSLFGGRGRLMHAAIGALVIAVITNGLGLLNLPAGFNLMVTGARADPRRDRRRALATQVGWSARLAHAQQHRTPGPSHVSPRRPAVSGDADGSPPHCARLSGCRPTPPTRSGAGPTSKAPTCSPPTPPTG